MVPDYHAKRTLLKSFTAVVSRTAAFGIADFLLAKCEGVNFAWRNRVYSSKDVARIASAMKAEKIIVGLVPEMPRSTATYYATYDFLALSADVRSPPQTLYNQSVVIHEVIHAIHDLRKDSLTKFEDEKAAFLFQAYYLRAYGFDLNRDLAGAVNTTLIPTALALYDAHSRGDADEAQRLEAALAHAMLAKPEYRDVMRERSQIDGIVGLMRR